MREICHIRKGTKHQNLTVMFWSLLSDITDFLPRIVRLERGAFALESADDTFNLNFSASVSVKCTFLIGHLSLVDYVPCLTGFSPICCIFHPFVELSFFCLKVSSSVFLGFHACECKVFLCLSYSQFILAAFHRGT